jgi:copper transport protein
MLVSPDGKMSQLESHADPHEVKAILATMPSLADGGYRVDWHIISADGHPVSGSISFSVGAAAVPAPQLSAAETHAVSGREPVVAGAALYPALLRGLSLSALLALCGLLGFAGYTPIPSKRQERLCVWLSGLATLFLTAHLIVWLIHVSPVNALDAETARSALSREVGLDELIRLILAALAAWSVILARRMRMAFAFALAAVLAGGAIGHPAAIDPVIAIPTNALHLVGVAFWLGGLLWLVTSDASSPDTLASASIVSNVALISIVVVALTGIIQSFLFLTAPADLLSTAYGRVIMAKVSGLLILAAFGAHHRYRLMPQMQAGGETLPFIRSVRKEILVMVLVVMIGGFLAYVPVPEAHAMSTGSTSHQGM